MISKVQRHFAFRHPLFKRQSSKHGVWWTNSVYYLWWEYLRRHPGYKTTCENAGKGEYEKLYAHFGDVHGVASFKEWWTKDGRGAQLFSEPSLPNSVAALTPNEIAAIPQDWDLGSLLIVAIPLSLPKRTIEEKLRKLVARHHKRKRGQRTFTESRALYPIAAQPHIPNLKRSLELYDFKQSHPKMSLWEVGQQFNLGEALTQADREGGRGRENYQAVEKKNVSAVAAHKKLKAAKKNIEAVVFGKFPVHTKEK